MRFPSCRTQTNGLSTMRPALVSIATIATILSVSLCVCACLYLCLCVNTSPQDTMPATRTTAQKPHVVTPEQWSKKTTELTRSRDSNFRARVLVYSYDDRLPRRRDLQALREHNRSYCDTHGYRFVFEEEPVGDTSCYWVKVRRVREFLLTGEYDYVMWIDSDVALTNDRVPVESLFSFYQGAFLVKSTDHEVWSSEFNAGVFVVRDCALAREFLDECQWWGMYPAAKWVKGVTSHRWTCVGCGEWANSVEYEQGAAVRLLKLPKYAGGCITFHWRIMQDHRLTAPYHQFQPFCLHFAGSFKGSLDDFLSRTVQRTLQYN